MKLMLPWSSTGLFVNVSAEGSSPTILHTKHSRFTDDHRFEISVASSKTHKNDFKE